MIASESVRQQERPGVTIKLRIIAGIAGGQRLRAPKGDTTRPTSDRVREALFSILGPPSETTKILDVFAGAGTLGFEALSRGAAHSTFLDNGKASLRCLRENSRSLGFEAQSGIIGGDSLKTLQRLTKAKHEFDWLFVDPPYASELAERTLLIIGEGNLCSPSGLVVCEHDRRRAPLARYGSLVRTDVRRYGDTELSLFRRDYT